MLFPVHKDGKAGYINEMGSLVIGLKFEYASDFSEGLAGTFINGKWGYISTDGDWVIEPQFDRGNLFKEGRAAVQLGTWQDGNVKWSFINRRGDFIIEPQPYLRVEDFSCGRALVVAQREEEKDIWVGGAAFLDRYGNEVIPFCSRATLSFREERAGVSVPIRRNHICIDNPESYSSTGVVWGGTSMEDAPWCFIDLEGKVRTSQYLQADSFCEGLARVLVGDYADRKMIRCNYIDRQDRVVIELGEGDFGGDFSEGLCKVTNVTRNRIFYMDRWGSPVTRILPFSVGGEFHEGLAVVRAPSRQRGHTVWSGAWGFIDRKGRTVIKPQFSYAEPFRHGLARVNLGGFCLEGMGGWGGGVVDGKNGYIDHTGRYVWEPTC